MVVTTIKIKNMAAAPIAGLKVDEFWYDKARRTGDRRAAVPAIASR